MCYQGQAWSCPRLTARGEGEEPPGTGDVLLTLDYKDTRKRHKMCRVIYVTGGAQAGLCEMTPDISKLVNLEILTLTFNCLMEHIPESISCLQKLRCLHIEESPILGLPDGLATLASLVSLELTSCEDVVFPSNLQVTGPKVAQKLTAGIDRQWLRDVHCQA